MSLNLGVCQKTNHWKGH